MQARRLDHLPTLQASTNAGVTGTSDREGLGGSAQPSLTVPLGEAVATYSGARRIWAEKAVEPDPLAKLKVAADGRYAKQRASAAKAGHDLPPVEQVQRRARDPIVDLHGKGSLSDAELGVAHDLRRILHGLSTDALAGLNDPARLMAAGVQVSRRPGRMPFAAVNDVSRFRAWRDAMAVDLVRDDGDVTLLQVAVAVVIDLRPTRQLDADHSWKRGTTLAALQRALKAY